MSWRQTRRRKSIGLFFAIFVMCAVFGVPAQSSAQNAPLDYTNDGVTDFVVVRNTGGGPSGAVTWWFSDALTSAYFSTGWGIVSDQFLSGDFDGDGVSDVAIWRSAPDGGAGF